jgi:hypothetical protein
VLSIFERELPGAAVIRLGREPAQDGFWTRTLHIIERSDGPCLRSGPEPPVQTAMPRSPGSSPVPTGSRVAQGDSRSARVPAGRPETPPD